LTSKENEPTSSHAPRTYGDRAEVPLPTLAATLEGKEAAHDSADDKHAPSADPYLQSPEAATPASASITAAHEDASLPAKSLPAGEEDIEERSTIVPGSPQTEPEEVADMKEDILVETENDAEAETIPNRRSPKLIDALSKSNSQEDPADPIEPSEEPEASPDVAMGDPIQLETQEELRRGSPPASNPKPGTAKRMKDREGKLPLLDDSPYEPARTPAIRRKKRQTNLAEQADKSEAESEEPTSAAVSNGPTPARRKAPRPDATTQPPPTPAADTPGPKRRGRPPLTAEEKARRAAGKEAEKQKRAAEKEAERQKKEVEKQRKAEEKKVQVEEKARQKAVSAKGRTSTAKKATAEEAVPELSESVSAPPVIQLPKSTQPSEPAPSTPASKPNGSQPAPILSMAKWKTLTESPSVVDGAETPMIDELRSSSPDLFSKDVHPSNSHIAATEEKLDDDHGNIPEQQNDHHQSEDDSPTAKATTITARPGPNPLFIPSDSQYPGPSSSQAAPLPATNSPSQLESQSQPTPSQRPFKRPITSWANQAKFRRLSDIASQDMFSPLSSLPKPASRRQAITTEDRRTSMYGDLANENSDSDSDSNSSDKPMSHIPKNRRAGVQKKELFVE
jgi:hypothetical protein